MRNLNYGGLERVVTDLVSNVDATRFEMHVLALQYLGRYSRDLARHATLHVAGRMNSLSMLLPRRLASTIRAIAPDVVHCHSGVWYKTSLAARMAGVHRIIYSDHGRTFPDPMTYRMLDHLAARRTSTVVAVSAPLAEYLRVHVVKGVTRIVVIENGIDTHAFRPRPPSDVLVRVLGVAPSTPVIGSVGRLESVKAFDVMLHAFADLRAGFPSSRDAPVLVIIGDGTERDALERQRDRLRLTDSVFLLGWRDNIAEILSGLVLYTMSSHSEGTSIGLLEAMACGLCPVVTNVGGNAAVLGPSLQHRLVSAARPADLANAWRDALGNDTARQHDGAIARARVCESSSLGGVVRAYERLYVE
jgi:glycosyltransferase involved in cell wall biosynthesis